MLTDRLETTRAALLAADVVCPHTDADGLAAGALALRARGEDAAAALLLSHLESPWGDVPDLPAGARVALLDQGVRPFARPGVLIDHHAPETDAPGEDVVWLTSFGEDPEVPTAPLVRRLVGDDVGPAASFLAGVGAAGDRGRDGLDLPECAGAAKTATLKLVPLVNAPRRSTDGPVRTALELLVEHDSAKAALADPRIAVLEECRRAWRAAYDRVVRTAPSFHGDVAVLRFDVPFQVHPLVAQTWARRLKPRPVLAANDGWVPGRVQFSVRGGGADADLRALLRGALPGWAQSVGDVGNGHPRATGGSLPADEFDRLLVGLTR